MPRMSKKLKNEWGLYIGEMGGGNTTAYACAAFVNANSLSHYAYFYTHLAAVYMITRYQM